MNGLISDAWAQAAPGGSSQFTPLLMVGVFFVIFYFLLFRPQQKRAKEHQNLISKLAAGDEVVTTGGVLGKVTDVGDTFVTLEIADGVLRASVPGAGQPATVVLEPSIKNGDVLLTPVSVRIGTRTFAPELLENARGYPFLRTAAGADLLRPQSVDVPELMPRVAPSSAHRRISDRAVAACNSGSPSSMRPRKTRSTSSPTTCRSPRAR